MGNTTPASEHPHADGCGDDDVPSLPHYDRKYESASHHTKHFSGFRHQHHQHLPGANSPNRLKPQKIPTVFRWTGGGKSVALAGSFDNWKGKIPMAKSHDDFTTIVELGVGTHEYKYLVDGSWTYNPSEPKVSNEFGSCNNQVTVRESDFEVFEALAADGASANPVNAGTGDFTQDIPERLPGMAHHRPPTLPPHLLQVVLNKENNEFEPTLLPEPDHVALNHLYALSIKDGVMTLSSTYRYKKKYVTTLLYRPV